MKLPWFATCRAMLAIFATSITLVRPVVVHAAAEEQQPPAISETEPVTPVQAGRAGTKSAEERIAELEARVGILERELRQLRNATQSAAAALASAAKSNDGSVIGSSDGGITIKGNAGSVDPAPGIPAPHEAAPDPNNVITLSEESKKEFLTEMRAMAEQLSNATPDERADAVRELMARLRAKDEAMKNPGGDSGSGKSRSINIGGNSNIADVPPQPPMVNKAPESTPPPPAVERMGSLHDPTRQRFDALNEEQRNRFISEMRSMREKLQYATPDERSAMVQEVLTKVEKETTKASTKPAAPPPAPPAKTSKE